jgi:hypothetical protein
MGRDTAPNNSIRQPTENPAFRSLIVALVAGPALLQGEMEVHLPLQLTGFANKKLGKFPCPETVSDCRNRLWNYFGAPNGQKLY